jgi:acetyl-CoA carboxylase, biotin carboxylase subunit
MKKILVANRGEIACRVMKTAKLMGIKTVAVYSEVDRNAPHVRMADEAYALGGFTSTESYLDSSKILNAAKLHRADAIHPGYGFLSENANFAAAVINAGLIFIGPSPQSIEIMGSKLAAKAAVSEYDIPLVPGTDYAIDKIDQAKAIATEVGLPILIKASAGGGGKGMRIVHQLEKMEDEIQAAMREAKSAFGDGSVFIEKYISSPRHIEFQILADKHGNIVHLFERECSIQRRHQKIVEEAPASRMSESLRKEMGKCAVDVARSCNYEGAGTVEFLVDSDDKFYFLEMNTRLQVEHPVTELITGVDLVEQQIHIARGENLSFRQEDLKINGHAVELRVYAENAWENFAPSIGKLSTYRIPTGEGVRVDDGVVEGMEVSVYYDPMLAKLITYGKDRADAIVKMKLAISEYDIRGIETTLPFGLYVMDHPEFTEGTFDTHFVGNHFTEDARKAWESDFAEAAANFAVWFQRTDKKKLNQAFVNPAPSAWKTRRL